MREKSPQVSVERRTWLANDGWGTLVLGAGVRARLLLYTLSKGEI